MKRFPVVLITGPPGVGKSKVGRELSRFKDIEVFEFSKKRNKVFREVLLASLDKKVFLISHPSIEHKTYFEIILPSRKQLFKISPFIPIFIYSSDQKEFIKGDSKKRDISNKIIHELLISHISMVISISKANVLFFNNFKGSDLEAIMKKVNTIKKIFDPLFYMRLIL